MEAAGDGPFPVTPAEPGAARLGDGVCADSQHDAGRADPGLLLELGMGFVRLVAFKNQAFLDYYTALRRYGIQVAAVLGRESFSEQPDYEAEARDYATWLAADPPAWWVCGNEMDAYVLAEPSPSSWSMEPAVYSYVAHQMIAGIRSVLPDARICVGGLVSGQADWLHWGVTLGGQFDAIDVHPYGKDADEARALLHAYRNAYELPLLVLEWHRPAEEIVSFLAMLRRETRGSCWFAFHDGMVPGFGLYDANGEAKPEAHALVTALSLPVLA